MIVAAKKKTVERTIKEGDSFTIDGIEIRFQRKRGHTRQIRVRVRYLPRSDGSIDTSERTPQ